MDWLWVFAIAAVGILAYKASPFIRVLLLGTEDTAFFALKRFIFEQDINPDTLPDACLKELSSQTVRFLKSSPSPVMPFWQALNLMLQEDAEIIAAFIKADEGGQPFTPRADQELVHDILKKYRIIGK